MAKLFALFILWFGMYVIAALGASFVMLDLSGFNVGTWHIAGRIFLAAAWGVIFISWLRAVTGD